MIAAAIVVVIAFGAVLIAARSGNGSAPTQSPGTTAPPLDASQTAVPPVITGVVPVSPLNDGKHYPRVYVDWPKGTKQGCVTSLNYYECSAGAPDSITFQTPILDPLSFRAVACFVVKNCDPQATDYEGPDEILGPWYRPRIDGSLLTLTPAAPLVQKDPVKKVYHLYVSLAQQPKAPAYAVYRNGVPVAILFVGLWTESCKPGVLCFDDEVMGVTGSTISYAVSACYSDCDPQSIQSGFAPATSPGPAVSVPGLVGT